MQPRGTGVVYGLGVSPTPLSLLTPGYTASSLPGMPDYPPTTGYAGYAGLLLWAGYAGLPWAGMPDYPPAGYARLPPAGYARLPQGWVRYPGGIWHPGGVSGTAPGQ